ncbi:MAG TPA: hypothetical protein VHK69_09735, partial [Chitinophagaceae bacterium]|nr:hypothetical protein [Chitinophagaceae bacterium]
MKTMLRLGLAAGLFMGVSCTKDRLPDESAQVKPSDAAAVTALLNINDAVRISGALPGPVPGGPQFAWEKAEGISLPGKYFIYRLPLQAGTAAGYYLQVKGASHYFRVESAPGFREWLILPLPASLDTGTLIVNIAAFNAAGAVSRPMEVAVKVGGVSGAALFTGTWDRTGEKLSSGAWSEGPTVEREGSRYPFNCINNVVVSPHVSTDPHPVVWLPEKKYTVRRETWSFGRDGSFQSVTEQDVRTLDLQRSACDAPQYRSEITGQVLQEKGGWYYEPMYRRVFLLSGIDAPGP